MVLQQTVTILPSIGCLNMLQCSTILLYTVSTLAINVYMYYIHIILESILEVLNDPSFERSQPSWVRRSRHSATKGGDETDQPVEEIKTEFEDDKEGERALLTMDQVCIIIIRLTEACACMHGSCVL